VSSTTKSTSNHAKKSISNYTKKGFKNTDVSSAISISDDDSDFSMGSVSSEEDSNFDSKFKVNVKVIIKVSKSDPIPAKWFTIESDDFDNSIEESSNSDEDIPKLKTKKSKSNLVPKESKLTTDEIELADIIMQIKSKYQCNIHITPCYIEDDKHLALNSARLHL
ncbi:19639_t:CDS:2, partial [Racocetra fulgida]